MNLGILGAGRIAVIMAKTVRMMNENSIGDVKLYAVAARDLARAQKFAQENGVEKAFGSYEEMLQDPQLDLVYVATPHSHHMEHGLLCVEHGKAALVEKAFTGNTAQARKLLERAEEKNVLVTEAIWTRYQPMRKMINEVVESGIVGEARSITCNLNYAITEKERIVDPALAGGALLDVGVYTLNFAEMIFGRCDKIQACCQKSDRGVDVTDSITLFWNDGRMAIMTAGIDGIGNRQGLIYCTKGYIEIENINNPQEIRVFDEDYKCIKTIACPPQQTGYEYEVLECVACLKEGKTQCDSMPHDETLHVMELMDEARRQMGICYPFD